MSLPRRVYLASPLSGDRDWNESYAAHAMRDSLLRGEAPFVPHLLYPLVLDDDDLEERAAGMRAGTSWLLSADSARAHGVDVEMRRIL